MRADIAPGQTSDYLSFELIAADSLPEPKVSLGDLLYITETIWENEMT
jgi:hypothetical protein